MKLCDKLYIFINLFISVNIESVLKKRNISLNNEMEFNECEKALILIIIKTEI